MIAQLAAIYVASTLAIIAALAAAIGAVLTDTYANWIAAEQKRQRKRRAAFMRGSAREVIAGHAGKQ